MFKALVLLYNLPPYHINSSLRVFNYLRNFKNFNWDITLVTSTPLGVDIDSSEFLKYGISISNLINIQAKHKDLSKYTTFKSNFIYATNSFFYIPDRIKSWAKKAATKVDELLKYNNFDILYISIPPFSLFKEFAYLKKKYDIPLIVDYGENWYGNYNILYPTLLHKIFHKRAEYKSLKLVDKVIVPNRKIKENLLSIYPFLTFEDIFILPNSYYEKDFIYIAPKQHTKLSILYPGSIFNKFDIMPFFNSFAEIKHNNLSFARDVEIHFITPLKPDIKKRILGLNILDNIIEHNITTLDEFNQLVVDSDIVYINLPDKKGVELLAPSLVYHLFGAKKTFLTTIPEGSLKNDLEKYNACYFAYVNNSESIKQKLLEIYDDFKNRRLLKPDYDFMQQFQSYPLTEELIKLFQFYLPDL